MFQLTRENNTEAVLFNLLRSLKIACNVKTVQEDIQKHPDYPSLLSISDILTDQKISHKALKIDSSQVNEKLPVPFIANARFNGHFVVVNKITDRTISLSDQKWNNRKIPLSDFINAFRGSILVASAEQYVKHRDAFAFNLLVAGRWLFVLAATLFLGMVIYKSGFITSANWNVILWTIAKLIGLTASSMLLIQSNGNNEFVQKICHLGTKTNCNSILESEAAKVFYGLSWSEVGFFYFSGTLLLNFFGYLSSGILLFSATLTILSLPYTFYSVYYQKFKAKQWCVLCCTVQAVLWLEFFIIIFKLPHYTAFAWSDLSTIIICLFITPLLWYGAKPLMGNKAKAEELRKQLREIKFNKETFESILKSQKKLSSRKGTGLFVWEMPRQNM